MFHIQHTTQPHCVFTKTSKNFILPAMINVIIGGWQPSKTYSRRLRLILTKIKKSSCFAEKNLIFSIEEWWKKLSSAKVRMRFGFVRKKRYSSGMRKRHITRAALLNRNCIQLWEVNNTASFFLSLRLLSVLSVVY